MADENVPQDSLDAATPGAPDDLFDFPDVGGYEEFGLASPSGEVGDLMDMAAPAASDAAGAPAQAAAVDLDDADDPFEFGDARPNPPVPEGLADLDEDLFGFDEVFNLDDDPFYNGTLDAQGQPTQPLPEPEPAAPLLEQDTVKPDAPSEPAIVDDEELSVEPQAAPAAAAAQAASAAPAPASSPAPDVFDDAMAGESALLSAAAGSAGRDRGPRILLPEDVPYAMGGNHGKIVIALVICFLLINTGIFYLAHTASSSVNNTMAQATGLLADAISKTGNGTYVLNPDPNAVGAQAPMIGPGVSHTTEVDEGPEPLSPDDPIEDWVDLTQFPENVQLSIGFAKRLMEEGHFREAREILNRVLANQGTNPVSPEFRQEIDFLIPLTYYEEGLTIAPEEPEEEER